MKMSYVKKWLTVIGCIVLIAALALTITGCGSKEEPETPGAQAAVEATVMGEGATVFQFSVVDLEGNETKFEIHTDKTVVGEALLELGLIEGDMGDYGLYVKKVNGITAEYEVDGTYWAFYEGDDYAMTGVDLTEIKAGATYAFKVSK